MNYLKYLYLFLVESNTSIFSVFNGDYIKCIFVRKLHCFVIYFVYWIYFNFRLFISDDWIPKCRESHGYKSTLQEFFSTLPNTIVSPFFLSVYVRTCLLSITLKINLFYTRQCKVFKFCFLIRTCTSKQQVFVLWRMGYSSSLYSIFIVFFDFSTNRLCNCCKNCALF